nr:putative CCT motif family protein [Tanacetum cinerariifolium]
MLHDVPPPDQPPMEQGSSPLSAQILEFCESELFQETINNSDVASACCYEEQSSFVKNISFPPDMNYNTTNTTTTTNTTNDNGANDNYNTMFDEKIVENDISAPLDFSNLPQYPFRNEDQFDLSLLQNHLELDNGEPIPTYPHPNDQTDVMSIMGPLVCEDESLSSMPSSKCMRLNNLSSPNHCFLDHPYLPSRNSNTILPIESCGIFNGNLSLGNEIQAHELDFQGDNGGIFCQDMFGRPYNSNELQALSNESNHMLNNGNGNCNPPLAPPEITSLESETFRVANKLTSEERREKIHRYMKKRNERNFSKKIKYACRKTLADSRPRVRGRFAKNDEFGEHHRNNSNTHEEDTDEDVKSMHLVVKEEEKLDSSDIFVHISGLNSLCNYPIQSWM